MTYRVPGIAAAAALLGLAAWSFWPRGATSPGTSLLEGLCEASTVVPWEGGYLVGDNEAEDRLFVFDPEMAPSGALPLGAVVEDVEALALLPTGLLVVGSQGANRKGEERPHRERVLLRGHPPVRPDLSACAPCVAAAGQPPKAGGVSVEGAAWWRGSLWLGLRSPLQASQALLLRMVGDPAAALEVAEVVPVDLGGRGIRELVAEGDDLLILAGPPDGAGDAHALFRLEAPGGTPGLLPVVLPPGAEGFVPLPDGRYLYVTDGNGQPGTDCASPATWGIAEAG